MRKEKSKYLSIKSKTKYFTFLCIYFFLHPFCKLIYGRKRNWLICERGTDAQDNGYFFFKYLREKQPNINAVYLIKRKSKDYLKVSSLGKTVEFGSLRHFLMAIGFPVKISSHLYGYAPWIQMATFFRRNKTKDIHVFLQHGITKNKQPGFYKTNCKSLKLFVCGAKPEYDFINSEFGYTDKTVLYTGFPRYDSLKDDSKDNSFKQILVFPTWRRYIEHMNENDFLCSRFFNEWNKFLKDAKLLETCQQNNCQIKLCLHPSIKIFSHCFTENKIVSIVNVDDIRVQDLINESCMLITDFSSIFYDFAYLNKPIVYFQFDEDEYYIGHYDKGYFDYRRDGFGPVSINAKDAAQNVSACIKNSFTNDQKYNGKCKNHFLLRDTKNSIRIFDEIIRLED